MIEKRIPEPPDLSFVRTGTGWPFTFWYRDDDTARSSFADEFKKGHRWWNTKDEDGGDDSQHHWNDIWPQPEPLRVIIAPYPGDTK